MIKRTIACGFILITLTMLPGKMLAADSSQAQVHSGSAQVSMSPDKALQNITHTLLVQLNS